jgi:RNA polymerase sigma-70 factor (ECF subfamily)
MSFDEDLADGQIADRLGVPVGTVRSRTYYVLRALRSELGGRGLHA